MVAELRYAVRTVPDRWILPERKVPESRPHDRASELFHGQLVAWVERTGRDALVARNLAARWDRARPRIGIDPDVCLIEPTPPERDDITSLCVWTPAIACRAEAGAQRWLTREEAALRRVAELERLKD